MIEIKNWFQKHDNIAVAIILFFVLLGFSLALGTYNMDEIWCFQNIYKMINGFEIYLDANVITTPLFYYIGAVFLKIPLLCNMFGFKIYGFIMMLFFYLVVYQIFKNLKICKKLSLLYTLILFSLNFSINLAGASYNTLALLFVLLGILFLVKSLSNNKKYNIIQGVILFLVFMTKQNIGVYYAIGLLVSNLIIVTNKKEGLKRTVLSFGYCIVLFLLFLSYLFFNGNLYGFIDYAFLGIQSFANHNFYGEIAAAVQIVLAILGLMAIYYIADKKQVLEKEDKKILKLLGIFSFCMLPIVFPIFNTAHTHIAVFATQLSVIYLTHVILVKHFLTKDKLIQKILIYMLCFLILISTWLFIKGVRYQKQSDYQDIFHPFFGIYLQRQEVDEVLNYIEKQERLGKKISIFSEKAAFYMIPSKRSNGSMDLPLLGNLGKRGEEGIISQIQQMENTQILINKEDLGYQDALQVKRYIQDNLDYVGEISDFLIYEK